MHCNYAVCSVERAAFLYKKLNDSSLSEWSMIMKYYYVKKIE